MRVFLAGAAGAIGRRLVPLLLREGHRVSGTTRSSAKAEWLEGQGATAIVVDVFNAAALRQAVIDARPDVVIHQLTDLSSKDLDEARARNARIRIEATPALVRAAVAAGARRFVAQSIAFAYAPAPLPIPESAPLNLTSDDPVARRTAEGVAALEGAVLEEPAVEGVVLRYGRLYGPGTWSGSPNGASPLHVDAAAHAALLATSRGAPGIYNVAEDDGSVRVDKARRELGFDPNFRFAA
ncbi:MAG TPA: NAD(P)-dependent oxidoreductase [Pseudorhodoplanes sp.]|nr:NAD(P)-dependent oxidoreductase [Pseudorhodoplanes sp.]